MAATHVYAADIDVTRAYTLAFVNKGRGIQPNPKSNP
jgi:hypothetical protein